jgi:orotate phosphoribosyltransferase-like protein
MSNMGRLVFEIQELVEQGMSAKFIAATLNVPIEWAEYAIEERYELEKQNQDNYDYGEY